MHLLEDVGRVDPFTRMAMEYGIFDDDDEEDLPPASASDYFPAGRYANDIEKYLAPKLLRLSVVELDIYGNQDDQDEYQDDSGTDFGIEYEFLVLRDGKKIEARVTDMTE